VFAVTREPAIGIRDVMPEEENIEQHGQDERKCSKHPNDESKRHTRKNNGLLLIRAGKKSNLLEECSKS
jgi:hypothetical protein